jgi:hypothetical protein
LTHLSGSTVTDKHELEGRDVASGFSHRCDVLWRGDCWSCDCARAKDYQTGAAVGARSAECVLRAVSSYLVRVGGEEGRWWVVLWWGHAAMFLWVRELAVRAVKPWQNGQLSFAGNSRQAGLSPAQGGHGEGEDAFISALILQLLSPSPI